MHSRTIDVISGDLVRQTYEKESPNKCLGRPRKISSGSLHLTTGQNDQFRTEVEGENGENHGIHKRAESSRVSRDEVFIEGAWIFPIFEEQPSIAVDIARPERKRKEEQANNHEDLD